MLNVSKKELLKDLQKAPEFDQSAPLQRGYEEEYGVFGGAPFGALLGNYEFGRRPGASSAGEGLQRGRRSPRSVPHRRLVDMFNLESFTQLDAPRDLAKVFETTE